MMQWVGETRRVNGRRRSATLPFKHWALHVLVVAGIGTTAPPALVSCMKRSLASPRLCFSLFSAICLRQQPCSQYRQNVDEGEITSQQRGVNKGRPHRGIVWFVRCEGTLTAQPDPTQHSPGHTRGRHHKSTSTIFMEGLEAGRRVGRAEQLR